MRTETHTVISHKELDDLINKYFPQANFSIIRDQQVITKEKLYLGIHTKKYIFEWKDYEKTIFFNRCAGKETSHTAYLFVEYLIYIGEIPEGHISIEFK